MRHHQLTIPEFVNHSYGVSINIHRNAVLVQLGDHLHQVRLCFNKNDVAHLIKLLRKNSLKLKEDLSNDKTKKPPC